MTEEWEDYYAVPRWRRWAARLLAVLALAGACAVLYQIYAGAREEQPAAAPSAIASELDALTEAAGALGDELEDLRPASPPRAAAVAARRTLAAVRAAARAYRESALPKTRLRERITNGLGAEFDYASAVLNLLEDPGDRVYVELPGRADRARGALKAMPDGAGLAATVRGVERLRAWVNAKD